MSILSTILGVESGGGNNLTQGNIGDVNNRTGDLAQGYFQITGGTWSQFGGNATGYSSALQAPASVQEQIAENIPVSRWGPDTQTALSNAGYQPQRGETLGAMLTRYGENPADTTAKDGSTFGTGGTSATGSAFSGGDSVTYDNQSDPNYGDITGIKVAGVNAPAAGGATMGTVSPYGSNDQGTPNLGGGVSTPSQQYTGDGQHIDITDLKGLGTDVQGAGKSVQTGATTVGTDVENASSGIAGTGASIANKLQDYLSSAFVVSALVVMGVIFVAFGLGMFKHNIVAAL